MTYCTMCLEYEMNIYDRYNNKIAEVSKKEGEAIMAYARSVQQNVGMGQPAMAIPEGMTVNYIHTYGMGSAQIFYRGSQIASA
jgi:hypothetical protein